MSILRIESTQRTPEVIFDFANNVFHLRGESYPEDVKEFYGQPIGRLEGHLEGLTNAEIRFTFEFVYFNSSTAKILMNLFDMLEETAARGNTVLVVWAYEKDDDNMEELGEEFGEELSRATFSMLAV
ncbi:MAG: protein of unknown function (DUF1987) [Solidesulfovibrio magneticus str. Maddingley MBC34]|uniref:SiaC family regulatory phosphoprotein domain-containing protein n=1 Tax=Solidesulfovibrio magneticus str. Maddingley MBC34 TaxID=1206767 RepID=K6GUC4_9BACT|nr:MAG: protein of unknown function (DUF1987) [Solidesulfovibrio magneticus str. Maddingley MBC34]